MFVFLSAVADVIADVLVDAAGEMLSLASCCFSASSFSEAESTVLGAGVLFDEALL